MNSCQYEEIKHDHGHKKEEREKIVTVMKQILIASTCWTQLFLAGLCVGAPTVFIPQIRKAANSTIIIDDEMGSWLYSTGGFSMFPWIFILPFLTKRWGRKLLQLLSSICSTAIFIILYISKNPYQILFASALQGLLFSGNVTFRVFVITEYVSIEYRGIFLSIKTASFFWGIWLANAIGTYFYWKNIAIVGFIASLYTFVILFCPESPHWLAYNGRIKESEAAHRWIYGSNEISEKKLREMLTFYEINDDVGFFDMLQSKGFYKPVLICVLTVVQYHFSGKLMCSLYILDIFKTISENEETAYSVMLILDGITVFGMYFGSFLSKILNRRTIYMYCSFNGIFILFILSIYLYLVRFSVMTKNNYVSIVLLMIYSFSISCGPLILSLSIYGEVIPIKFQATCYMITGLTFAICYSILIKLTPTIFASFGMHGTFLFYCVTCGICTAYLYVYLPETKNKTLEEIELFFSGRENRIKEQEPLK